MRPRTHPRHLAHPFLLVPAALLALTAITAVAVRGDTPASIHAGHDAMGMTAEGMERMVTQWYAAHPTRGAQADAAPVDSFLVSNFNFDENHDGAVTQVDTARILRGQAILWKLSGGSHTVTNGTASTDPDAGSLFDQPLSVTTLTRFTFTFDTVGTFPFFCRIHELSNMRGVVVVTAPAGVELLAGSAPGVGFVRPPAPNPTRGSSTFSFALARAGRVHAVVLDLQGRRVAELLDQDLAAGTYRTGWDGDAMGRMAAAGVYLVRLEVPGLTSTRRLVLVR